MNITQKIESLAKQQIINLIEDESADVSYYVVNYEEYVVKYDDSEIEMIHINDDEFCGTNEDGDEFDLDDADLFVVFNKMN